MSFNKEKFKTARTDRGISCAKFAILCGIGTSQVYAWESGEKRPKAASVIKVAKALRIRPEILTDGEPRDVLWLQLEEIREEYEKVKERRKVTGVVFVEEKEKARRV